MASTLAIPRVYGLATVTAPVENPVSLDEIKSHLRIDHADEDVYLTSLCKAATLAAEAYQDRQLVTATYDVTLDGFPSRSDWRVDRGGPTIFLPKSPLQSVTSVKYLDGDGVEQTLAATSYTVDSKTEPARIVAAYDKTWPTSVRWHVNAVTVRIVCGWGGATAVPETTKLAVKTLVAWLYENREPAVMAAAIPMHIRWLLDVDRVVRCY